MINKFPFYFQLDEMDCGPSCLRMIAQFYKKDIPLQFLRDFSYINKDGVSLLGISQAAEKIGFQSSAVISSIKELKDNKNHLPAILHWDNTHFVVLYKIKKTFFSKKNIYKIADPSHGLIKLNEKQFLTSWFNENKEGIVLYLEPTTKFYTSKFNSKTKLNFKYLIKIVKPYKKEFITLFFGLFIGSLISLIFPFLTQSLIDKGVENKSLNIVFVILIAQIFLFLGSTVIEIIRNWITLYIGTRINITIISDFLRKILQLPISFFDTKLMGDFHQRIQDHERIEQLLTSNSLTTIFSFINFSIFFIVLLYYDYKIVLSYTLLTFIAIIWSFLFLKYRRVLDYQSFQKRSENQESIYEIIDGIHEIKLNNFETYKRKKWESIQINLFNINLRVLRIDQLQIIGFDFINQLKNILVTFITAREVIIGNITLGSMLAVSYIIGQMNSPINQLTMFFRSIQDAKLSLERLSEIQGIKNEEKENQIAVTLNEVSKINIVDLSFQYEGPKSPLVLSSINLSLEIGKITAIVGESGSGKTTLMKLILKYYKPIKGQILLDNIDIERLSTENWRKNCGTVLQDGYIFSDTIERNIATSDEKIDIEKLKHAIKISNLDEFINTLPLKEKTKIGNAGSGISGGQKQRILIARAVYKNPHFIFLDEATSALDAQNERIIHNNLQSFFKNKTVLIIAHRLSTVKNADCIIVLKEGKVVEKGNHKELVKNKKYYYNLIKNQLELGL